MGFKDFIDLAKIAGGIATATFAPTSVAAANAALSAGGLAFDLSERLGKGKPALIDRIAQDFDHKITDLHLPDERRAAVIAIGASLDLPTLLSGPPERDPLTLTRRMLRSVTDPDLQRQSDRDAFETVMTSVLTGLFANPAILDELRPQFEAFVIDALKHQGSQIAALIAAVQRPEGLSLDALLLLARRVNADTPDRDAAIRGLERAVEVAAKVIAEGLRGSNIDALVDEVLKRLAALTAQGRLTEARAEAARALAEAREGAERAQARHLRMLDAMIEQDILARDPKATAARIAERTALDHPDPADRFTALRTVFMDWHVRGRDKGLNFDLDVSIALARQTLAIAADADQRGTALNDLANALQTLGERETGTARLEEAVTAYRAALEEWTRDRVPLDWARAQVNLGSALRNLGEREPGTARLEEAVTAYRAALEEWTRDRAPLDWATTQMNLGNALQTLGERETGRARLEEAVAAYRAALTEWTRDRMPLDWARAQMNLGNALATLGQRETGTARLEDVVTAYRAALEEMTRDLVPLDWASVQMNLGNALATLGERETGTARLEEAVTAYRAALEERTRDRMPLDWANTTGNLGSAQVALADRTADPAIAREALDNLTTAEATLRAGGHIPWADACAAQIPAARALVTRLSS
jgi:tetratricopeptide (TPR) repeat protein